MTQYKTQSLYRMPFLVEDCIVLKCFDQNCNYVLRYKRKLVEGKLVEEVIPNAVH